MRYKITVEYDGEKFCGWQRQLSDRTVQQTLEEALEKLGIKTVVTASGRTDSGVHAAGQVAHFDAECSIPTDKFPLVVNAYLPDDVSVTECEIVSGGFNARFDAKRKTYCYRLYYSRVRHPLLEKNHTHVTVEPNENAMRHAAEYIVGEHDFKCFEASGSKVKSTVRTVYSLEIKTGELKGAKTYEIYVTGNGFLYNMVRIIAGTLYYVGIGKLSPDDVKEIIKKKKRVGAGKTMPPKGLTLEEVFYQ